MSEQGTAYTKFIESELEAERERRKGLDSRGASVVTTSSALATAVFALGALVTARTGFTPDKVTTWSLLAGLALFATAAFCGLMANRTIPYDVTDEVTLKEMRNEHWEDDEVDARNITAYLNIQTICDAEKRQQQESMVGNPRLNFSTARSSSAPRCGG